MLGLLAHGLHLLLVVLGLVGVVALLLPQLRDAHSSRAPAFRPPATVAEHEERIAELRSAVRTGQLTVPRALASKGSGAHAELDASLWRSVAVSSSGAAAFVHAAMFPHHLSEGLLLGAFFLLSSVAQALWAVLVARRATDRLLLIGVFGNLACIGLWATTRTVGLPFGLIPGPEGVGAWDVSCVVWEWAVVLACTAGLHANHDRRQLALGRLGQRAWLWVGLSGVALAVLSLTVGHG